MRLLVTQGPVHQFSVAGAKHEGADCSWPGKVDWQRGRERVRVELVRGGRGMSQGLEPFIAQRRNGFLWPQICWIYACSKYTLFDGLLLLLSVRLTIT